MSLKHCPNCGGLIRLPELQAGHAVRCDKCGYTFAVPDKPAMSESQRRAVEREERRRRREQKGGDKEATKSKWLVPALVACAAVLLTAGGILLRGCGR
ncbi:MAG TPA: hypothetical protein VL371_09125 [Gemmataceae bacterium]|jgi:DNA-directed RNA polymerase subunit M/transcription elongation factor TFIIS|nr:hypothetical protein [Gemmataceae bacterium]